MNVFSRGIRNAFRNSIRTFSIVVILGLSIGLALAMLVARQAVQQKISSVKSSIGNTIVVSPAGARGFEGGGEPLTNDVLAKAESVGHVVSATKTLQDRIDSSSTNLQSAVDAGTLGQRFTRRFGGEGGTSQSPDIAAPAPANFAPPIIMVGTNNVNSSEVLPGGGTIKLASGLLFDSKGEANEALIGQTLATKNSLSVGSTFKVYDTDVKVVGIYDAGNAFANNGVVLPIATLQKLSSRSGEISNAILTVDSIDNMDGVETAVKAALGSSADVVSNKSTAEDAVAPLENVKTIAAYSFIGALAAGAIIILLTMVMIVRERRREIGVMKAIGASNLKTVLQFMAEAVTLTVIAAVVGLGIGTVGANPITKALVNNSSNSSTSNQISGPGGGPVTISNGGPQQGFRAVRAFGNDSLANLRNIKATVGLSILFYGLGAALLIALIGTAIPAWFISKVRPAEVMRME